MDLTESPQEQAFRAEVRTWLASNVPKPFEGAELQDNARYVDYLRRWQRTLAEGGWLGITWPKEHGGRGLGPVEQAIAMEEMARARVPMTLGFIGIELIAPTIATLGTEAQKRRHLPKILTGEEIWAQGFSEPNAGSDVSSLATRAVLDGDHFVVNGQKIWTSFARVADWIYLLVRTDPTAEKHQGLTALLVDLKTPGVSVRPLKMMSGSSDFNSVFFSDVRVPVANVLGKLNGGWQAAIVTLMHERASLGGTWVQLYQFLEDAVNAARIRGLTADSGTRQKIAQSYLEVATFRATAARALTKVGRGQAPGPEGSILKLFWSDTNQRMAQRAMEILGPYGQLLDDPVGASYQYLRSRGNSIEGGTSEILRNTIAQRVLGLPKSY